MTFESVVPRPSIDRVGGAAEVRRTRTALASGDAPEREQAATACQWWPLRDY